MSAWKTGAALGACLAAAMAWAGPQQVDISKFAFTPKEVTVAPGAKVTWVNHDEIPHTVSGRDKSFVSKALDTDDRYEHVFDKEGDYAYFCAVHPYMTGVVHVRKP
ncbi:cupredoxin family copper-binding protein [Chromobacterium vaccinii]|uniref:cupredoxin domain-containing protein n=1 Tax=Chromobacterium vaccinii TaxID=1108595 RepID=UPI001E371870|nr:cupredoxin family copper-binding protein [Chromobacterium vaccinii]MCD4500203.1 cupredoxin family copper-binding protein [Chromobacterium vaccinii]